MVALAKVWHWDGRVVDKGEGVGFQVVEDCFLDLGESHG